MGAVTRVSPRSPCGVGGLDALDRVTVNTGGRQPEPPVVCTTTRLPTNNADAARDVTRLVGAGDRAWEATRTAAEFASPPAGRHSAWPPAADAAALARLSGDYAAAAHAHGLAAQYHEDEAVHNPPSYVGGFRARRWREVHLAARDAHRAAAEEARAADRSPHEHHPMSRGAHVATEQAHVAEDNIGPGQSPAAYRAAAAWHGQAAVTHGVATDKAQDDGDVPREEHHRYWEAAHRVAERTLLSRADSLE